MKLTFSPVRMDQILTASVLGEVLTLNDEAIDLSAVTEAAPMEDHSHFWIVGTVRRIKGELHLTLILPHGASAPPETLFPEAVEVLDGQVPLPPHSLAASDPSEETAFPTV